MGKLPEKGVKFLGLVSGWTATLLFMWMAVSQMVIFFLSVDRYISPIDSLVVSKVFLIEKIHFSVDKSSES